MTTPDSQTMAPTAPRRIWTTLDLLKWTRDFFSRKGIESPRLEAELLLAGALACERVRLYTDFEKPLEEEVLARFRGWVKRRAEQREPLAYILGRAQFMELQLDVSPAVLIPRPETEELALWARTILKEWHERPEVRVLDVGTGSGCLALALAHGAPNVHVTAVDISPQALDVARRNAATLKLSERVQYLDSDVYSALSPEHRGTYDLLVSNPPYIDPVLKETLTPEVREHEPALALFAASNGLAIANRIVDGAWDWLKSDGWLGMEISPEQAAPLRERLLAQAASMQVDVRKDVRQSDRFVLAHR